MRIVSCPQYNVTSIEDSRAAPDPGDFDAQTLGGLCAATMGYGWRIYCFAPPFYREAQASTRTPQGCDADLSSPGVWRERAKNENRRTAVISTRAPALLALFVCTAAGRQAAAAAPADPPADLVVAAGRPLRVALDDRVRIKQVGQPVTGTLIEPVYALDRLVVPSGTPVRGHVAQLVTPSRGARMRAWLGGDFSPHRRVVLQFDTLVPDDGHEMPLQTVVNAGIPHVKWQVAAASDASKKPGVVGRAGSAVQQQAHDAVAQARDKAKSALAMIKQPGKLERLRDLAIERLPYHPQFLSKGTVFDAQLVSPLHFGAEAPVARAAAGSAPAPESMLMARLVTALNSSTTPRGTSVEAVVTEPVFSADHELIFPEGTKLTGEVTLSTKPRRFHRNGKLRFLFEQVQVPEQESAPLLASLHSVQASDDDHVVVDDEGGAAVTNSKTRFIAPALGILALRGSLGRRHADGDGDANDAGLSPGAAGPVGSSGGGGQAIGGFLGFGLIGVALGRISRPLGVAFAVVGVGRTMYTNVLGKGKDVSFPADTPIEVQLAPGPARPAPAIK
jgi:hypothetical protein